MTFALAPLLELATGYMLARALHVANELRILDLLEARPLSATELAAATGADAAALARLLRPLASLGLVTEQAGKYAPGPLGRELGAGSDAAAAIGMVADDSMWNAFRDLRDTVRTGAPALRRHRAKPMYPTTRGTANATLLAGAMRGFHDGEPAAVAASLDLGGHQLVVDVGGGSAGLAAALVEGNPGLRAVIYDLPDAGAAARSYIAERGLGERCRFEGGDFFEKVPAGADLYLLSHVLHDWSDPDALAILTNVRAAIGPGGKLLIVEIVRGERDADRWSQVFDLILLGATEGRLRSADEHAALLEKAGLRLDEVVPTPHPVSVIRAVPIPGR